MHFIYFLGRFHVLAVHLPITLVLVVALLEWMTRQGRRPELKAALGIMWAATAITAIGTVILGYMHFSEGGFQGVTAQAHRALGTTIAVVSIIGWIMFSRAPAAEQKARSAVVVLLVALVVVTGHFGGELTHGDGYLTQYAPNFLRVLAGLKPTAARATTLAAADPYKDYIAPVLDQRCSECHSTSKMKGGLDLSSYATIMKGGGDGPVIVKGNAKTSDLIRRVSLPQTDDDFMPKGKDPLTADQIAVFTWWINAGAKTDVKVADLNPPQNIQTIIQDSLSPAPGGGATAEVAQGSGNAANNKEVEAAAQKIAQEAEKAEAEPVKQADPKVIAHLVSVGFMARQVSAGDTQLVVSPALPGAGFSAADIQALSDSADQIVDLNLADSSLSDSDIAPIAHLTNLTHLRLDDNKLTDQSLQVLSSLPMLVEVNLYNNKGITDAGVQKLADMKSLKRVYLFQTGVTKDGVAKLHQLRPDLTIDDGDMSVAPVGAPQTTDPAAHQDPKAS